MKLPVYLLIALLSTVAGRAQAQRTPQDDVTQITKEWLVAINTGDRSTLNRIMDARCLVTTPAGDILSKERLVPEDESRAVQTLHRMELNNPIVRVYADTAILMTYLKPVAEGQEWAATFVYVKQLAGWKLVALQGMARK
jgi:hypothetical protein